MSKYWPGTAHISDDITGRAAGKFKKGNTPANKGKRREIQNSDYFANLSPEDRHALAVYAGTRASQSPNTYRFSKNDCSKGGKLSGRINGQRGNKTRRKQELEKWGLEPDAPPKVDEEPVRIDMLLSMAPPPAPKAPAFLKKKSPLWE